MREQQAGAARVRGTLRRRVAAAAALLSVVALSAGAAGAARPIAIFDFEPEDTSAGPASTAAADAAQPAKVTDEVRARLARSGRFSPVEVDVAKAHTLRDCDGCEAAIARGLGRRGVPGWRGPAISRTEYIPNTWCGSGSAMRAPALSRSTRTAAFVWAPTIRGAAVPSG